MCLLIIGLLIISGYIIPAYIFIAHKIYICNINMSTRYERQGHIISKKYLDCECNKMIVRLFLPINEF